MKSTMSTIDMFDVNNPDDQLQFNNILATNPEFILDQITLDNLIIIIRKSTNRFGNVESNDMYHGFDVNVAIAAAITEGCGCLNLKIIQNIHYSIQILIV